jgi:hypothetical protein
VSATAIGVAAARSAGRTLDSLLERPRTVLATLAAVQIAATVALAARVEHNGWVYFQGGDQIWFSTTGWLLGRLQLAPTQASYMWPLVQTPITWVTGSTYLQALPVLVVLNVLVLGPIALCCLYGIASRIGGSSATGPCSYGSSRRTRRYRSSSSATTRSGPSSSSRRRRD